MNVLLRSLFRCGKRPNTRKSQISEARAPAAAHRPTVYTRRLTDAMVSARSRSRSAPDSFLRLELVRGDPVAQDFPVEGLWIDMQEGGGLGAVAAHLLQDRDDVLSLDVLQAPARRPRRRLPGADLGGQILRLDLVLGAEDHGPLDRMLQLPHIAGPVVTLQRAERNWRQSFPPVRRVLLEEVLGEGADVLATLAERRQ